MRNHFLLVLAFFVSCNVLAQSPKYEFRAAWLATVQNIDWPDIENDRTATEQKQALTAIFDKYAAGNMHACCLQVRSLSDAMYNSSYEPWSESLTGTRGKDPGYDPLAFAIEEAHKRGLELHIWVNPFRVTSSGSISTSDKVYKNAGQWIIKYNNGSFKGQIIDPGYPEARAYVLKVLMEIINNYDVDGIIMDDYFYPYGGTTTEDAGSKNLHKPNNVVDVNQNGKTDDDWRRTNVDQAIKMIYDSIQAVKPWVRFGMGPFGIWSTQKKAAQAYGLTLPSGISGLDDYDVQACNTVEWVKGGFVDYIAPQLYWSTQLAAQDYDVLAEWWAKDVCENFSNKLPNGKKVHFFSSQAAYHAYDGYRGYDDGVLEVKRQIESNRANLSSGYTGSVFYNTTAYVKMYSELASSHFPYKALPPAMDWKAAETLSKPTNLTLTGTILSWEHSKAERFTVYVFPQGVNVNSAIDNPAYLQGIVWQKSFDLSHIQNLNSQNIAVCAYDRYGNEYEPALYTVGEVSTDIEWVLNGGYVLPEVPTNDSLWNAFKPYYITYYGEERSDQPKENAATFAYKYMQDIMTNTKSAYKWLGDYVLGVASQQSYSLETESAWRWHVRAFFNASDGTVAGLQKVATADYSTAGLPSQWGSAYQIANPFVFPTSVSSTYTLPIPMKANDTFLGWYDNASFSGTPITSIPAGWSGTLYARWTSTISNLQTIQGDTPLYIYDIMGRLVGNRIDDLPHQGIYIVVSGNNMYKIYK